MWTNFGKKLEETLQKKFEETLKFKPSITIKCLKCGKMSDENETEAFWKIASRQRGSKEEGKSLSGCSSCKSKDLEMIVKASDIEYRCSIDECSECFLSKVDIINWEEVAKKREERTFDLPKISKEYVIKEFMRNISELCQCEVMESNKSNIEITK